VGGEYIFWRNFPGKSVDLLTPAGIKRMDKEFVPDII